MKDIFQSIHSVKSSGDFFPKNLPKKICCEKSFRKNLKIFHTKPFENNLQKFTKKMFLKIFLNNCLWAPNKNKELFGEQGQLFGNFGYDHFSQSFILNFEIHWVRKIKHFWVSVWACRFFYQKVSIHSLPNFWFVTFFFFVFTFLCVYMLYWSPKSIYSYSVPRNHKQNFNFFFAKIYHLRACVCIYSFCLFKVDMHSHNMVSAKSIVTYKTFVVIFSNQMPMVIGLKAEQLSKKNNIFVK